MTEGTVSKWLKDVGDLVEAGDLLVEVSTDKITNQIESAVSGTLLDIVVPEGSVVPVKAVLAHIGQRGEAVPREQENNTAATAAPVSEAPAIMTVSHRQSAGSRGRVKASSLAKRMALEKEISLPLVTGDWSGWTSCSEGCFGFAHYCMQTLSTSSSMDFVVSFSRNSE